MRLEKEDVIVLDDNCNQHGMSINSKELLRMLMLNKDEITKESFTIQSTTENHNAIGYVGVLPNNLPWICVVEKSMTPKVILSQNQTRAHIDLAGTHIKPSGESKGYMSFKLKDGTVREFHTSTTVGCMEHAHYYNIMMMI